MNMQIRHRQERYVLETRMPLLRQRIDAINEKLRSAKAPLIEMNVSGPFIRRIHFGLYSRLLPVMKVELDRELNGPKGEVKMLALSTVDKTTQWMEHKTFTKLTPEQDVQVRLTDTPCLCDHCGTNRIRVYMYTLEINNEIKRVGSGCVDEFAGLSIRSWQAAYEKAVESIEKYSDVDFSVVDDHSVVPVMDFLKEAVMHTKEHGYLTFNESGRSSGYEAFQALGDRLCAEGDSPTYPAEVVEKAKAVRDHILKSEADPERRDKDYWCNLLSLVKYGHLTMRQSSLLCSSIKSYETHLSKLAKPLEGASLANEHFGTEGERIPLKNLQVASAYADEGKYGWQTKISMYDEKNRLFEWNAAGRFDLKPGDTVHLVGTLGKPETFESKKYAKVMFKNTLKRCKFHSLEEIDELIEKAKTPKAKRRAKEPTPEAETQPAW
jgi:hypothetical protein